MGQTERWTDGMNPAEKTKLSKKKTRQDIFKYFQDTRPSLADLADFLKLR